MSRDNKLAAKDLGGWKMGLAEEVKELLIETTKELKAVLVVSRQRIKSIGSIL